MSSSEGLDVKFSWNSYILIQHNYINNIICENATIFD